MDNKSWDNLAADYDKSVEDNQSQLIINYLNKEIEILNRLFLFHFYSVLKKQEANNKLCWIPEADSKKFLQNVLFWKANSKNTF